jgi:hypothetical protein
MHHPIKPALQLVQSFFVLRSDASIFLFENLTTTSMTISNQYQQVAAGSIVDPLSRSARRLERVFTNQVGCSIVCPCLLLYLHRGFVWRFAHLQPHFSNCGLVRIPLALQHDTLNLRPLVVPPAIHTRVASLSTDQLGMHSPQYFMTGKFPVGVSKYIFRGTNWKTCITVRTHMDYSCGIAAISPG